MAVLSTQNAIEQSTSFETSFLPLKDPRRTNKGAFDYPLQEIILLAISSVLCGYSNWTSMVVFGESKLEWLRQFYPYTNGIPSHDTLGKLFQRLDPNLFSECFTNWVNEIACLTNGEVVAIDGKTIRGSGQSGKKKSALHVVSAYATDNRISLAQKTVNAKSNEIIAIPELLNLLTIKGCIVTIDAMGCQKSIASKIIEKEADYVLMVKDNQKELLAQVIKMFKLRTNPISHETTDAGHGRVETRLCEVIDDLTFFDDNENWKGLKSVIKITSTRHLKKENKTSVEYRYYITSLSANPEKLNQVIRSHWRVENNLHWSLDVIMGEDKALKKKGNSAINLNVINKMALHMLEKEQTFKATKPGKMTRAALDDKYRECLLKVLK